MFEKSKEKQFNMEEFRSIWKENSNRVCNELKKKFQVQKNSIILLRSAENIQVNDEDTDYIDIHQVSNFQYIFGLQELDCYGIVDIESGKQVVFIKRIPEEYKLWMIVKDKQQFKEENKLDEVYYVDEMEQYLEQCNPSIIYLNDGVNSDSGSRPKQINLEYLKKYEKNIIDLYEVLTECRVFKSQKEMELMKWIIQLSCEAHVEMMVNTKVGMKEYQLGAMFQAYIKSHSNGLWGYSPICASGTNCSVLHYINNEEVIQQFTLTLQY